MRAGVGGAAGTEACVAKREDAVRDRGGGVGRGGSSSSSSGATHPDDDAPLLRFLQSAPSDPLTGKPYYDLDYALRLCKQAGRTQPCVHIYAKMGLYESSVDLALEKDDLELAKINADMPEDDDQLRKKLWLKIAKYVVQDKQDIKM